LLALVLSGAISLAQTPVAGSSGELTSNSLSRVAAVTPGWAALKQSGVNREAKVVLTDGKSYRGDLLSVTDDALVIRSGKSDQTIAQTSVKRVLIRRKGHRGRNALIGAGIGAATGLGLGVAADQCSPQDLICFGNRGKEILTPFIGFIGAGVGALIPTGRWQEAYGLQ